MSNRIAKLIRDDTSGASHVVFVVRDDSSHSDLLFGPPYDLAGHEYTFTGHGQLKAIGNTKPTFYFNGRPVIGQPLHDAVDRGLAEIKNEPAGEKRSATNFRGKS